MQSHGLKNQSAVVNDGLRPTKETIEPEELEGLGDLEGPEEPKKPEDSERHEVPGNIKKPEETKKPEKLTGGA